MERDAVVEAIYRTNGLATGTGQLAVTWTEAFDWLPGMDSNYVHGSQRWPS
jgi:hypothetical protein